MSKMERAYDEKIQLRISREFQRLKDHCYLDHAGATLYSEVQMKNICDNFCGQVFGNPHSLSLHSKNSTDIVDKVRNRILRHFHTSSDEYSLIFTSGSTASIRMLVENFDWSVEYGNKQCFNGLDDGPSSIYIYTQSNHTSVVGARELAADKGIPFLCLGYDESISLLSKTVRKTENLRGGNSLFAYPAQCNFSGRKYPMEWIQKVQSGALSAYGGSKWFVLLDAAAYCSTNDLDLSVLSPDFVCLSFYKIFGYPTGLGALLVRNESAYVLKKTYFGGGTVEVSLSGQNFRKFRKTLYERFEDGTISFLSIIALDEGLRTLERLNLNMNLISRHVFDLSSYTFSKMSAMTHWNGEKLVEIYADSDYSDIRQQGGIISFNLIWPNKKYIGYTEVLHIANLHGIQLRTGCFCNAGACQRHLKLSDHDLMTHFQAGHVCGDEMDLINGRPTGSIRISFGYMTTYENVDMFLKVISDSFQVTVKPLTNPHYVPINSRDISNITLKKIWTYPVKSCGGMEVDSWKMSDKGLEYDREWMIVADTGVCITQKQKPKMTLILPKLDLQQRILTLTFQGDDPIIIRIDRGDLNNEEYNVCESKVCSDRITGHDCGDEVGHWLSRHLEMDGLRLIQQSKVNGRRNKKSAESKLSLSNKAQYLLINNQSVQWLQEKINDDDSINKDTFVNRFRGNFLIDGAEEFSENNWSCLFIGSTEFQVDGPCGRCQMICIDQETGEKNQKPMVALSRALNGKLRFGIYLSSLGTGDDEFIRVGDRITIREN